MGVPRFAPRFERHVCLYMCVPRCLDGREKLTVALIHPNLLPQLAPDVREPLSVAVAVEAHSLQAAVAQHLDHLRVLLALLLEDELALLVVVLILSATAILATLFGFAAQTVSCGV